MRAVRHGALVRVAKGSELAQVRAAGGATHALVGAAAATGEHAAAPVRPPEASEPSTALSGAESADARRGRRREVASTAHAASAMYSTRLNWFTKNSRSAACSSRADAVYALSSRFHVTALPTPRTTDATTHAAALGFILSGF